MMANWSELPNDILERLTSFLPLPDYHRFGAVCQNWWSIAKQKHHRPAYQLPWLVLHKGGMTGEHTFFNLSENKHYYINLDELQDQYLCGSSFGLFFTIDHKLDCRLLNPFTLKKYDLPPFPPYGDNNDMKIFSVRKAILDHDPSEGSDFQVVIMYGKQRNNVAICKSGDPTWNLIKGGNPEIDDVMFFRGRLYVFWRCPENFSHWAQNKLYVMDNWSDMKITEVKFPIPDSPDNDPDNKFCSSHLVDFNGELLLVQKYIDHRTSATIDIKVYKIDLEGRVSYGCKHIEGYAIFLGMFASPLVADPRKFPSCQKNAIYFEDGSDDLMIYDMDRCMFTRYYSPHIYILKNARPIWFNPNLL